MEQVPRTSQQAVQEQMEARARQAAALARSGGTAAQEAVSRAWSDAQGLGQKLALVGGIVGIASFFMPWVSMSFFFARTRGSGLAMARNGFTSYWLFPLMMAAAVFLTWLHLHSTPSKRVLNARWLIAGGAAWSWHWISTIWMASESVLFGGFVAFVASILVLAGGIVQTKEGMTE